MMYPDRRKNPWGETVNTNADGSFGGYGHVDENGVEQRFDADGAYAGFSVPVTPEISAVHHTDGSNAGYILHGQNGERVHYDEFGNFAGVGGVAFPETSNLLDAGQDQTDFDDPFGS